MFLQKFLLEIGDETKIPQKVLQLIPEVQKATIQISGCILNLQHFHIFVTPYFLGCFGNRPLNKNLTEGSATYTITTKSYHLDLRLQIKFTAFSYFCYTLFSVGCFADIVKNCHCQCIFDIVKVIVCKTNFPNIDFIHHYQYYLCYLMHTVPYKEIYRIMSIVLML